LAHALVFGSGENDTAPLDDPGWDNVGRMSLGSGVYLGDGWVLTPLHVYQSDHQSAEDPRARITLDQTYYEIPGTARAIEHSPGVPADLMMFRINGNPDLDVIEINSSAPFGRETTIISTGRSRVGDLVTWPGGYTGFRTEDSRVRRWGRNVTFDYAATRFGTIHVPWDPDPVHSVTGSFLTYFDDNGLPDEAQPVSKDSGGGAFVENEQGEWQLAGLALAIKLPGGYSGPNPSRCAVYGNGAYYADLSRYYSQIEAIRRIPLPGDSDMDGDVDLFDITLLQWSFGQTGAPLYADFNNDEVVDIEDFLVARSNYGMVSGNGLWPGGSPESESHSTVPEPGTLVLLTVAIPLLLRRKK